MNIKTIDKKDITAEMLTDLDNELQKFTVRLDERLNNLLPISIFQEKHTTGHLWWKKTYYTYKRYSEGSMLSVSQINVKDLERK